MWLQRGGGGGDALKSLIPRRQKGENSQTVCLTTKKERRGYILSVAKKTKVG